jgi:hypothetical protein
MKLQEYFDRGSQMTANTGWFYGLIFTIAGGLMLTSGSSYLVLS